MAANSLGMRTICFYGIKMNCQLVLTKKTYKPPDSINTQVRIPDTLIKCD